MGEEYFGFGIYSGRLADVIYTSHRESPAGHAGTRRGRAMLQWVSEGEFKSGAGTVGGTEGRRKVGHGLSVARTYSPLLFSGDRAA